jgi:hypothetical protein
VLREENKSGKGAGENIVVVEGRDILLPMVAKNGSTERVKVE